MTLSIDVVDIKNNMHQLSALPIEESVFVLMSQKPDALQIKNYVTLIRIDSDSVWPSVGDPNYKQILFSKQHLGTVNYNFSIIEDGTRWMLEIDPIEKLYTNSRYILFIEKGLPPEYYNLSKVVTRGNSSAVVSTKRNLSNLLDDSEYKIIITGSSVLGQGTHTIRYSVLKDDVQILTNVEQDILSSNVIELNENTSLELSTKYPFIINELFVINLSASTRLQSNRVQEILTHVDADVIKTEDNISSRIQHEDILNFYKNNVFIKNPEPATPPQNGNPVSVKYRNLNTFTLVFEKDISQYIITPSTFTLEFSELFNNYLLSNMGKYNTDNKYIVKYKIATSHSIVITVEKDTLGVVGINDKYVVQEI